ncbi:biliverdin-producing heme oxygenase [uncultured Desulfobacter sp.]|uniref:biliverdin-producing heme oxygenase n=1 Tax=uncultured Desulfobacter sp. TaxID=240139 RepID=UPI0029C695E1|nr:biliverdin-producing heme oxygenase [uncultured Desulfobacter sp.]
MAQKDPVMVRLKTETSAYHAKFESLPYFESLIAHQLPLACYVNQLRGLSIIHSVLETEIANTDSEIVAAVWEDGLRKLPLLKEDLDFFKPRVIPDDRTVVDAALAMTQHIRLRQVENPVSLLGYLYVLEGSTLGNSMHQPDIIQTFCLGGLNGCAYYTSYADKVRDNWNRFTEKMNQALDDPSLHDNVIESAHEAFAGLKTLYEALYPLTPGDTHITRINPEAGNHPMPEDEREIEAALAASQKAWDSFTYYRECFGERGKRFSDSDICWLATLHQFDADTVKKQVDWLSRLLAGRGMPTVMMEYTLKCLHQSLVAAIPENEDRYAVFLTVADELRRQRTRRLPETQQKIIIEEFENQVGSKLSRMNTNVPQLILSALIDEENGFEGASSILEKWYTDRDCFSEKWIKAVNHTIKKVCTYLS